MSHTVHVWLCLQARSYHHCIPATTSPNPGYMESQRGERLEESRREKQNKGAISAAGDTSAIQGWERKEEDKGNFHLAPSPSTYQQPFCPEVSLKASSLSHPPPPHPPPTMSVVGGGVTGSHSLSSQPAPPWKSLSHSDHFFHPSEATGERRQRA